MLLVVDPAIRAVLAAEAVFERVLACIEKLCDLSLDPRKVVGMNVLAPEIRIAEIFRRCVAEQAGDVVADKGRGEIVPRLETVDHRWRGIEQPCEPRLGRTFHVGQMKPLSFPVLARRVGQDTLDDVGDFAGIGSGFQHLSKREAAISAYFLGVIGGIGGTGDGMTG